MVPDEITTLDEAVDSFNAGKDKESAGKFDQSDTAARTCLVENRTYWGMSDDEILRHIGTCSDTSRTTMYGRLLVGRVFPRHWRHAAENVWCQTKHWSHFEVCARQWSEEDPDAPVKWLEYCVENDLSVRRLKMEIEAVNGAPPQDRPIYVLDAATVTIETIDVNRISIVLDRFLDEPLLVEAGDKVVVTVVKPEKVMVAV